MCSDFLLLNVRSCRYKYYTSAVKELWVVFDTPPAAAKEREIWGIPPKPPPGAAPLDPVSKNLAVLRKQYRARLLAPYTGGNGLGLSDFGRAACAFTFAGRLTLS
jgi:hypothetical protein